MRMSSQDVAILVRRINMDELRARLGGVQHEKVVREARRRWEWDHELGHLPLRHVAREEDWKPTLGWGVGHVSPRAVVVASRSLERLEPTAR